MFEGVTSEFASADISDVEEYKQPWKSPAMYVEPSRAHNALGTIRSAFQKRRSTFRVVEGKNGDGKSQMLARTRQMAKDSGLAIVDFHFEAWEKKPAFKSGYVESFLQGFYVPTSSGYFRLVDLFGDEPDHSLFGRITDILYLSEDDHSYLNDEFLAWPAYAQAFYVWCNTEFDRRRRTNALKYLRGAKLEPWERTEIGVPTVELLRSHHQPELAVLEFYAVLCHELDLPGLLVTYDEVETLGTLGGQHGRWALTFLRTLENFAFRRLKELGRTCHVILAFTGDYIEASFGGPDVRIAGVRAGATGFKTLLSDVPRLARIIRGSTIKTALTPTEFVDLLERLRHYYGLAYNAKKPVKFDAKRFVAEWQASGRDPTASDIITDALGHMRTLLP